LFDPNAHRRGLRVQGDVASAEKAVATVRRSIAVGQLEPVREVKVRLTESEQFTSILKG